MTMGGATTLAELNAVHMQTYAGKYAENGKTIIFSS